MTKHKYSDEMLVKASDGCHSVSAVMENLGIRLKSGRGHTNISKRLKSIGISISPRGLECKFCGEDSEDRLSTHSRGYGLRRLCKTCEKKWHANRRKSTREQMIAHKGGKCERCGYNKCTQALDFHHPDPKIKDAHYAGIATWSIDKAKREVDKCILLCANCHREEHFKLRQEKSD